MRLTLLCTIAAILGLAGWAALGNSPSPYAGEQGRPIKALSAEEQADLLAGRGMGLAKAGELNSYPGPAHVLALQGELQLDGAQRAATQALFDAMQTDAQKLGAQIVALEGELDRAFASRAIDQDKVERLTAAIGALQGKLRAVHLSAHLAMKQLLSAQQVAAYDRLRGYGESTTKPSHDGHKH